MEIKIFRPSTNSALLGVVMLVVGIGFLGVALKPVPVTPSQDNVRILGLLGLMLIAYGVTFLLRWYNGILVLDEQGIRLRSLFGGDRFKASWDEITRLDRQIIPARFGGRPRGYFTLHTRRQIVFLREFGPDEDLERRIRQKAPHLPKPKP